ncbi:reverse transcriptase/maturase protein [mine drainage metagenome]|uniref:Reverse transcriptase/maturase protein n=1 Tax=mine drainage metagenome TaxID=410659 RepID=T0YIS5_9ZZZZ
MESTVFGELLSPAVKQVQIPKRQGGVRILGVPTVADRIAQQVIKARIEGELGRPLPSRLVRVSA